MKKYVLNTGAGDTFSTVAANAKALAISVPYDLVEFEFNGVICLVNENTNLEWLYRDYANSWTMEWKVVGPDCLENYEPEVQEELQKRTELKEKQREEQQKEYDKKCAEEKYLVDELVKDVVLLIHPEKQKEYAEYVAKNSNDGYSRACVDYAEQWAKLMQIEISKGKEVKDIADECQKPLSYLGITGFMYGCAVSALAHFWIYGEALRKCHNKEYGVSEDKKGVVNPALLTISTK